MASALLTLNHMVKFQDTNQDLVFGALANATRRAMTESLLRDGPQAMMILARPFGISLPGIKKHVSVLAQAGIVTTRKKGRENIIAVNPATLRDAAKWFEFQARFWNVSLNRLEKLLNRE